VPRRRSAGLSRFPVQAISDSLPPIRGQRHRFLPVASVHWKQVGVSLDGDRGGPLQGLQQALRRAHRLRVAEPRHDDARPLLQ